MRDKASIPKSPHSPHVTSRQGQNNSTVQRRHDDHITQTPSPSPHHTHFITTSHTHHTRIMTTSHTHTSSFMQQSHTWGGGPTYNKQSCERSIPTMFHTHLLHTASLTHTCSTHTHTHTEEHMYKKTDTKFILHLIRNLQLLHLSAIYRGLASSRQPERTWAQ